MIRLILAVLVVASVPLSAWSSCNYFRDGSGALYLGSGNGMRLEIEVKNQGKTLEVLKQVCDATFQAIACKGFTLSQDEYIHGEHDGFGMTPTVNLGRDRARLTIGYLDPWIAQFAAENYEDDQNGVYASIAACEYHRSRIAIEAAERSHDVFVDQEREKARSDWMKNYSPNFHGLKH
jgi:hypothetical protein